MPVLSDTIRPDSALLSAFRADSRFDYNRELVPERDSVWQQLMDHVERYFHNLFHGVGGGDPTTLLVTIAVIILIIAAVVVIRHSRFFYRNRNVMTADNDEDNIYGVDFEKEIAAARKKGDWRRVVRFIYLQTLRALADGHHIDWRPSKTPTQYTYEVKTDDFKQMTRLFLRVRYGGFPADEAMAEQMVTLKEKVLAVYVQDVDEGKEVTDEA